MNTIHPWSKFLEYYIITVEEYSSAGRLNYIKCNYYAQGTLYAAYASSLIRVKENLPPKCQL